MKGNQQQSLNPVFASSCIVPLINADYFRILPGIIDQARTSIDICMFSVHYAPNKRNHPINQFFDALRRAAQRGVRIRLLMNASFHQPESRYYNQFVARYFKSENFQAALAGGSTRLHAKFVLIDNTWVCLGSHNFSQRASGINVESSVLIRSQPMARLFAEHFTRLWNARQLVKGVIR